MDKKTKLTTIILSVLSVVFLATFLLILILVVKDKTLSFDFKVINKIVPNRNDGLTGFIKLFTRLGSVYFLAIVTILLAVFIKDKMLKLSALFAFGSSAVVATIFKYMVRRDRPLFVALIEETGYSFPSAHAMITTAVFVFIAGVVFMTIKNKPLKIVLMVVSLILPILVGLTRVYLGVHYMTDVLAGFMGGVCCALVTFVFYIVANMLLNKQKRKKK